MNILFNILYHLRKLVRGWRWLHRHLTEMLVSNLMQNYSPVLSIDESINYIINHRVSVSRFGDGELKLTRNIKKNAADGYQDNSQLLHKRLNEILYCNINNLHIAIIHPPTRCGYRWQKDNPANNYQLLIKLGNSIPFICPPPRLNADLSSSTNINLLKKIWANREIVLVTNSDTKNQADEIKIFDNANSIEFILVTKTQAFANYTEILHMAKHYPQDKLFLLACGMTATVLAYDLHIGGYQAIDIGAMINRNYSAPHNK